MGSASLVCLLQGPMAVNTHVLLSLWAFTQANSHLVSIMWVGQCTSIVHIPGCAATVMFGVDHQEVFFKLSRIWRMWGAGLLFVVCCCWGSNPLRSTLALEHLHSLITDLLWVFMLLFHWTGMIFVCLCVFMGSGSCYVLVVVAS